MKKNVYMIKAEEVTADWGRHIRNVTLRTVYADWDTVYGIIEEERAKIAAMGQWWMGYGKDYEKDAPKVWAELIVVEGL